ncbi:DNA translocase FtsK [uncultured Porphyromonas sp.]|uniref:FtsK/SpoIIIE family DNA translocase n=1 Tax=uncultured Porphyromonas sp. TaxID=159274 RepID=UPI002625EFB2|nr:DNA translocase FtsK [uncultured Porphyromonas sp.]
MATSKDKSTKKRSTKSRKRTNASGRKDATTSRSVGSRMRSWAQDLQNNIADKRYGELISFILGLILLAFIIYILVACGSYLMVGSRDQSIVTELTPWEALTQTLPEGIDSSVVEIQNITRVHGAYLAHWLMDGFLGFGSWFLLLFGIACALRMMRITKRGSLIKLCVYAILLSLWTALALSALQNILGMPTFFRWGGAYGALWLGKMLPAIGWLGVSLTLLVTIITFIVAMRYEYLQWMRRAIGLGWVKRPSRRTTEAERDAVTLERKEEVVDEANDEQYDTSKDEELETPLSDPGVAPSQTEPLRSSRVATSRPSQESRATSSTTAEESLEGGVTVTVAQGDADSQAAAIMPQSDSRRGGYQMPSPDLLADVDQSSQKIDRTEIKEIEQLIIEKLSDLGIGLEPVEVTIGPTVTLYEFKLDPKVKVNRIRSLEDDIAMKVESIGGIRIIAPMPGRGTIGIEVPNRNPRTVGMKALITSQKFITTDQKLPIAIGRTITNDVYLFDLSKMPHLLIAGATGQGKSVGLNALITSLLYNKRPEELKLILIDPKMLEFSIYESIGRHFLTKLEDEEKYIITDTNKALPVLESLCVDMDGRYELLARAKVRNIAEYNKLFRQGHLREEDGFVFLPYLVLIVDEFADLIMTTGRAIEKPIARLAQKARAAGIHIVLATQRPSTDVITGLIKANFPARIAFKVSSQVDSRTILDTKSAKDLIGRGDMLINDGKEMRRIQCAFIDTPETERLVDHISRQPYPTVPYLLPEPPATEGAAGAAGSGGGGATERDPLFEEVARHVVQMQQGSTSNIQRRFNIGYNRAGRIMDQLYECGIVSAQDGSKPRQVLIADETTLDQLLDTF